jgi:Bacterial Ig-like domain (group 2)
MTSARSIRNAPRRAAMAAVAIAALAACGGTTEVAAKKDVIPFTISTTATDTLRAAVGSAVAPITVTVVNKAGEPLDTTLVTFAVVSGGGTLSTPSVRTNASGQASTTWTLGSTVGLQTLTATTGTLSPITMRAVASAGTVAAVTKLVGDAQTATVGTNVAIAPSVKVVDKFGNPLAGQLVTFSVGSGNGSVTGAAVNSDNSGTATVGSWRLGAGAGANTLVATTGTFTATFTATGAFGAASIVKVTPTSSGELFVGKTVQITAQVTDASSNVIPNAPVTFTSSNAAVATVSTGGLVTATGAGTASITAASGSASANFAVTVTGHPAGSSVSSTIQLGATPADIVFSNSALFVSFQGLQQVQIYDLAGPNLVSTVPLNAPAQFLVAPSRAVGPAMAVNVGASSRMSFIDPVSATVAATLDVNDVVQSAAMTSDGTRAYVMISSGQLVVIDAAAHVETTRISLGGGVTAMKISGDTLLYAFTSIGVIFEVDIRANVVNRQIISSAGGTDFTIGRDGLFYFLDGPGALVRIAGIANLAVPIRTVGVSPGAKYLALTPDGQQIWLSHPSIPAQVTFYTGNVTTGFIANGQFGTTNNLFPGKIAISPNGSFAVIGNTGGWIDIVR